MSRRSAEAEETGLHQLLTSAQVARALQVNASTLSKWRAQGIGPKVVWLSERGPRYSRDDVNEWLERAAK
jgi:hypothetical protein